MTLKVGDLVKDVSYLSGVNMGRHDVFMGYIFMERGANALARETREEMILVSTDLVSGLLSLENIQDVHEYVSFIEERHILQWIEASDLVLEKQFLKDVDVSIFEPYIKKAYDHVFAEWGYKVVRITPEKSSTGGTCTGGFWNFI